MDWNKHVKTLTPYIVRITTPDLSGTGFVVDQYDDRFILATAAHVVRNARTWGQMITLQHYSSGQLLQVPTKTRKIGLHNSLDSAWLETSAHFEGRPVPEKAIELVPLGEQVPTGTPVGWLGFPWLVQNVDPCFFSGHVSACVEGRYFIDGVAIKGVSGGPAFCEFRDRIAVLGSVAAYHSGGESLPGLMVADTIGPLARARHIANA